MKPVPGVAARLAATRVVDAVMHHGRSLKAELATVLPALPDPRDRALAEALCFAVLRHHGRFDAALRAWIPKPLGRRDAELRSLLMVGLAQLDVLKLAPHAAVAATVDTARALGRTHQAAMVNAVLRRAGREGVPAGIGLQWPAWLRTRLQHDWGDDAATILEASSAEPPLWLRVNRQRGSREAYAARLAAAELAPHIDEALPDALRLDAGVPVSRLPGFAEGDVSVQDASAQLVADALPLASGLRVLDACAAPGGKSAHLLEREPGLQLVALDVDEARLQRVRETLRRVGLDANAHLQAADSTALDDWWNGEPFDAVLLDAPCSATGIVRRQPDVLLHRRESDLNTLLDTQRRLLDALWTTVAPGGVLLYATCSVLKAENEAQVQAFLECTPNASVDVLDERFGRSSGAGRQRLPGERGYDGFFYARLRKA